MKYKELKDLLKLDYDVHIVCNEKEQYTKASGNTPSLLTALSCYVKALKENKIDENFIRYAVEQGLMDEEELSSETKKNLDELMKKIFE